MKLPLILAMSLGLGLGCAVGPAIRPGPGASVAPDDEHRALATGSGVRMAVDSDAWRGFPDRLDVVIPVKLTIVNDSGAPIELRYPSFSLVTERGGRLAALPPMSIHGTEVTTVPGYGGAGFMTSPRFVHRGFLLAPGYGPYYPGFGVWDGPFAYDPLYYDTMSQRWPVELPTSDMLEEALPEGVLEDGGSVTGFVYFERLPREVSQLSFRAELVNARTGERLGVQEVPFVAGD